MIHLRISATMRIAIGLAFLAATVVLAALMCGMVPSQRNSRMQARARVCENIAASMNLHASDFEFTRMRALLRSALDRNADMLSAGVRTQDGQLVVEVAEHREHWKPGLADNELDQQVVLPIITGKDTQWGAIEIRFAPLSPPGLIGYLQNPAVRLMIFIPSLSLIVSFLYLRCMLQHLDPSKAVPSHVRSALDTLTEGLLVIDKKQRIVFANEVIASWLNLDSRQLVGQSARRLPWILPEQDGNQSAFDYPWARALAYAAPQVGSLLKLPISATDERTLVVNASPVMGHQGSYSGVLVTFEDVTELEANRVELGKARDAAEQANRAKSDFLARMSHEIRTPMNAILGYADVLRRGLDNTIEDRQSYVDTIHTSGEHLLSLINDILDLSKIESGRMELELTPCSPDSLLRQVVSVLQVKAQEKHISLSYEWDGPAPETIITDQVRFRQTIMNLVGNAIKFTEQGGVKIVARLVRTDQKSQLAIDVIDTGVGIPSAALEKIFDPFSQGDTSVTRRFGGTGLGLAISRQLAEAMGGTISVRSKVDQGTTFTVTVDTGSLKRVRVVDAADLQEISQRRDAPTEITLPPARVLVVDDNQVNRDLMNLVLTRAGVQVDMAENGQEALEQVARADYDVVFMDMQMPVMDGYTATAKLREQGIAMPIIALTGNARQEHKAQCLNAGCTAFLTKPLQMDCVLKTLAEFLIDDVSRDDATQPVPPESEPTQSTVTEGWDSGEDRTIDKIEKSLDHITELAVQTVPDDDPHHLHSGGLSDCDRPPGGELSSPPMEQPVGEPLISELPMDDAEFRAIVETFAENLVTQLDQMNQALQQSDFDTLQHLAHTLKGSGGCAGFPAVTDSARLLEEALKTRQTTRIAEGINELEQLRRRIVVPAGAVVHA